MKLDIAKLIQDVEELVYSGNMEMAERGEAESQIIELENGRKYELTVVMNLIKET